MGFFKRNKAAKSKTILPHSKKPCTQNEWVEKERQYKIAKTLGEDTTIIKEWLDTHYIRKGLPHFGSGDTGPR